jgi:YesN/AraC family two-component response regulator
MTAIIAEDNSRMRQLIKRILQESLEDLEAVYECRNGRDAINLYEQYQSDWVLMDIEMAPVDGLRASYHIKKTYPQAKIIIITQYDDAVYRDAAKKTGVFAYLLKEHLANLPNILKSVHQDITKQ